MKINNPNLFFFPPNSIKVRESQSTKDCIVLISKREREKVEYCSCGNFQPIIYPHQTLWERGRGQAWGRKFSTHLFLTFEEQIADYAHVGNFLETFITLALCFRLENLQHKRGQTTSYHIPSRSTTITWFALFSVRPRPPTWDVKRKMEAPTLEIKNSLRKFLFEV